MRLATYLVGVSQPLMCMTIVSHATKQGIIFCPLLENRALKKEGLVHCCVYAGNYVFLSWLLIVEVCANKLYTFHM